MPTPFIMPKMDMDQEQVTIIEWLKKEGDDVKKGEPVLVIETDKITSEVESPDSGKLAGLLYKENEDAPVTEVIAYILKNGETESDLPDRSTTDQDKQDKKQAKASVNGDGEKQATPVARRMAEAEGIDINQVPSQSERVSKKDVAAFLGETQTARVTDKLAATPAARRIASERGLALEGISGSGPRKRIQAEDVKSFLAGQGAQTTSPGDSQTLSTMRKRISERLTFSYQETPHIYLTVEVDMHQSEISRKRMNSMAAKDGMPDISLTAYLLRILAWCLKRHPYLNASFQDDQILFSNQVNIGVATALEDGLIVPVLHNADQLSINELNMKLRDLTNRARQSDLTHGEIQGGTFTISNLGMYGINAFTAIINPPQSAILAVGAIVRKPIVSDNDDNIVVRPVMTITLGADHRIIDGAVAANFLADLVTALETPGVILM